MKKRLLSKFLAITVAFATLCSTASAFVPQGAVKYSPDVIVLNQDFSDASAKTDFIRGTTFDDESDGQAAEVVSGKLKVSEPNFNLGSNFDLGNGKTRYVLEFSVSVQEDYKTTDIKTTNYSLYWYSSNRGKNGEGYGFTIPFESINAGVVRTYHLVVNESADTASSIVEKAFVKEDNGEFRELAVEINALKLPANGCYVDFAPKYLGASEYNFYLGGKSFAGGSFEDNMPYEKAPVLEFDDIKVFLYQLIEGNTPNLNHGISYSKDFEDDLSDFTSTDVTATQKEEANGNNYYTLQQNNPQAVYGALSQTIDPLLQPNTTITLDLKCEKAGMPFLLHVGRPRELETIEKGTSISYGTAVTATAKFTSSAETAKKAEFYVNGKLHATVDGTNSFETSISGLKIGTSSIFIKMYCESGLIVDSEPQYINVDHKKGKAFDIGQEYEVDYKYVQGDGSLDINDGYFKLSISHGNGSVSYTTADGIQNYANIGKGDYKIVVASGYAEIYWNGQFLTSMFLPYFQNKN